jgi:C1A family cysteine protease
MTSRREFLELLSGVSVLASLPAASQAEVQKELMSAPAKNFNGFYFGWIPDLPRLKIQVYSAPKGLDSRFLDTVDLRPAMPPIYDQGQIGSCTSNAVAAALQFARKKAGQTPDFPPSRLFIYYNGRITENTLATDSGLSIGDGIRATEEYGVCPETEWPYDSPPANDKGQFPNGSRATSKPRKETFQSAYQHRAIDAHSIASMGEARLLDLKACLAEGYPFAFGFTIYRSFFDAEKRPLTNIVVPSTLDLPEGGHAVLAVGYDESRKVFICRNSWGLKDANGVPVQDKGHFYMPYAYLINDDLVADFWTIRSVNALM